MSGKVFDVFGDFQVSPSEASQVCGGSIGPLPPVPMLDLYKIMTTGPVKDIYSSIGPIPPVPALGM